MNTKSLLLITFFLLFFCQTISSGNILQNQSDQLIQTNYNTCQTNTPPINKTWDWNMEMINNGVVNKCHPNSDDDGKSHRFHFERYARHRSRLILCLLGKLILSVIHLTSLIICCIHSAG